MPNPGSISISDYSYLLPEERIAAYPLADRDASRLLIYKQGIISEDIYRNIAQQFAPGSLLVFNNTKVVEARLLFRKPTGGMIEIFCLAPYGAHMDITRGMQQKGKVKWECLVGGASKWKRGQVLEKTIQDKGKEIIVSAVYVEKNPSSFIIELSWSSAELSFAEILHLAGAIPLPPYIKRSAEESDKERYQTTYAEFDGSVAAPTAGLHFTPAIFNDLREKNINTGFVTLHVGAGTFKPVKTTTIGEHDMHSEFIEVSKEFVRQVLVSMDNDIIAVGTTSLRTLESLYWLGLKSSLPDIPLTDPENLVPFLSQWEVYELENKAIHPAKALTHLLEWMDKNGLETLVAKTQVLIAPGYHFRIVNGLVTNFHQPQSTLLLLIAAFTGTDWQKIYDHAMRNNYRFLSYGDGSLLWRNERI